MRTIQIRLPDSILATVETIQSARLDQPDRSSVIRELLAEAIAARAEA